MRSVDAARGIVPDAWEAMHLDGITLIVSAFNTPSYGDATWRRSSAVRSTEVVAGKLHVTTASGSTYILHKDRRMEEAPMDDVTAGLRYYGYTRYTGGRYAL